MIATIRRQEARAVSDLLARYGDGEGRALEIGPGTGYYTVALARGFREVVAVEECGGMVEILRERLAAAGIGNVTVREGDFRLLEVEGLFDVVVAIGVLDYISDAGGFVGKMCGAARRAVIFTVPQTGFWGWCFAAGGRLRRIRVYRHERKSIASWAGGWRCSVAEVGLASPLTRGLTLVAGLERP